MTDDRKTPADLRDQAGDDDEAFNQLMVDYGYRLGRGTEELRAQRRALNIGPGYLLPDP